MELYKYKEYKPHFYKRILWKCINVSIFRCIPGHKLSFLRNFLLRIFGAKIPSKTYVSNLANIYAPWNLEMGLYSCIGQHVNIYNKDKVIIGNNSVISQGSYLCTASHDTSQILLPLVTKPIVIEDYVWIASDVYINMGVVVQKGSVIGARAAVFKDVDSWSIMGGNPAKLLKKRIIKE